MQPASGGVLTRAAEQREEELRLNVGAYFYGPRRDFSPKRVVMGYVDLDIYQIGGGVAAGASMLPIGEESSVDQLQLTPVSKSKETLLLALCAVSLANSLEEVRTAPVAGFVHISEVSESNLPRVGCPASSSSSCSCSSTPPDGTQHTAHGAPHTMLIGPATPS
jgi:hypothetical protein